VGKEGDESPPSGAVSQPRQGVAHRAPVEIARIEMGEIFASAYKHYESTPWARCAEEQHGQPFRAKLTFSIKDYMDSRRDRCPEIAEAGATPDQAGLQQQILRSREHAAPERAR